MARNIFSIPSMSVEVERLFSSTKLILVPARNCLLPNGINALGYIRSWTKEGLILGNYFEYLPDQRKAREHFRKQSRVGEAVEIQN